MIGFDDAWSRLGRDLAVLRADPTFATDPLDLDHAVAGRDAVLRLARSITRTGVLGRPVSTENTDPAAAWITAVNRTSLVHLDQAHDLLADEPRTPVGGLWGEVHRMSVVAQHHWQASAVRSRPRGDQAWSLLADTAALSGAVAELDPTLAGRLREAGRAREADVIAQSTAARLAPAATFAVHQARTGDLPQLGPLVPNRRGRTVALDPETHGIVKAWANLLAGLRRSSPSPEQLRAVLTAVADAPGAAVPEEARRRWITAAARVNRELGRLRSLQPGGARASIVQAQLIARATASDRPTTASEHAAATAPRLVRTVASTALTALRERRWLDADGADHDAPLWSTTHRWPDLTAAIGDLQGQSQSLAEYGQEHEGVPRSAVPPRDYLPAVPGVRPSAPGVVV